MQTLQALFPKTMQGLGLNLADKNRKVELSDLRIMTKRRTIAPLALNRVQRHLIDNLTGRDLVLKSRQVGVSTVIQGWLFEEALNTTARIGSSIGKVHSRRISPRMEEGI